MVKYRGKKTKPASDSDKPRLLTGPDDSYDTEALALQAAQLEMSHLMLSHMLALPQPPEGPSTALSEEQPAGAPIPPNEGEQTAPPDAASSGLADDIPSPASSDEPSDSVKEEVVVADNVQESSAEPAPEPDQPQEQVEFSQGTLQAPGNEGSSRRSSHSSSSSRSHESRISWKVLYNKKGQAVGIMRRRSH